MKNEKLNKFIEDKWENYSWGLSLGVSLRKDKEYRYDDVKDSFSAGINEFLQVLHHNNIDVDKLDFDVEWFRFLTTGLNIFFCFFQNNFCIFEILPSWGEYQLPSRGMP